MKWCAAACLFSAALSWAAHGAGWVETDRWALVAAKLGLGLLMALGALSGKGRK